MSLSETHQPKDRGGAAKPTVFVDGASGTTGLGIADGCGCRATSR